MTTETLRRARDALEPFAKAADTDGHRYSDGDEGTYVGRRFTWGELLAARTAITTLDREISGGGEGCETVPTQLSKSMRNEIILAMLDNRKPQELWDRVLNAVRCDRQEASRKAPLPATPAEGGRDEYVPHERNRLPHD